MAWLLPTGLLGTMAGQPFSQTYLLIPGLGLALMMASLIIQCARFARRPRCPRPLENTCTFFSTVALSVWVVCLGVEDGIRWSRDVEARIRHTALTNTGNAPAAAELARLEAANGKLDAAQELLENCERASPWYQEYPYIKAEILFKAGDPGAAHFYLGKILTRDPDDVRARRLLSNISGNATPPDESP